MFEKGEIERNKNIFFLFSNLLDKRSKIRNHFEKSNKASIIACYPDNEANIRKIILDNFQNNNRISNKAINLIADYCGNNRSKLKNEIDKIKLFFVNKEINESELIKLLNIKEEEDFNEIKDEAIKGDKFKTNKLLNSTVISSDKSVYYLSVLFNRLIKFKEILKKDQNIEKSVNELKPPLFWKDKPIFLTQIKMWNIKKLDKIIDKIYSSEISIKKSSQVEKNLIIKKLLIDICNLASAA